MEIAWKGRSPLDDHAAETWKLSGHDERNHSVMEHFAASFKQAQPVKLRAQLQQAWIPTQSCEHGSATVEAYEPVLSRANCCTDGSLSSVHPLRFA